MLYWMQVERLKVLLPLRTLTIECCRFRPGFCGRVKHLSVTARASLEAKLPRDGNRPGAEGSRWAPDEARNPLHTCLQVGGGSS